MYPLLIIGAGIGLLYLYQSNYGTLNRIVGIYNPISQYNQAPVAASFDKNGVISKAVNDRFAAGQPDVKLGTTDYATPEKVKFNAIRRWYEKPAILNNMPDRTVTGPGSDYRNFINPSILGKVGTLHKMKYFV